MNKFEALGLGNAVVKAVTELGFETPTPIQEQAIPVLLNGFTDLVAVAQTGTGKTAAFGLPLISMIDFNLPLTQALILCPTRELCVQITKDLVNFSTQFSKANIVPVYGGASIGNQIKLLKKGAQIVVATPGRMTDLINRRKVDFSQVNYVVLDEADEMLDMGFKDDLDLILSQTPSDKSTWLFSATMPDEVRRISRTYMNKPVEITVGKKNQGNENIEHVFYVVKDADKYLALKRITDHNPDIFAIVFCRTKIETQQIADALQRDGYNADSLHGDLSQAQRDMVMKRYRSRNLQMLVATDVAARGIDVNDVTHVINFNLPDELESYTHRSGRTARAGKKGISISLVNHRESGKIKLLERLLKMPFEKRFIPTGAEVCNKQVQAYATRIMNTETSEQVDTFMPEIMEQLQDLSKEDLVKKLLSMEMNRFITYYQNQPDVEQGSNEFTRKDIARLFVNLGKMDGLDKGSLVSFISETAGIDTNSFPWLMVKDSYSLLEINQDKLDVVMKSMKKQFYRNRPVIIEVRDENEQAGGKPKSFSKKPFKSFSGGFSKSDNKPSFRGGDNKSKFNRFEKEKGKSKNTFRRKEKVY